MTCAWLRHSFNKAAVCTRRWRFSSFLKDTSAIWQSSSYHRANCQRFVQADVINPRISSSVHMKWSHMANHSSNSLMVATPLYYILFSVGYTQQSTLKAGSPSRMAQLTYPVLTFHTVHNRSSNMRPYNSLLWGCNTDTPVRKLQLFRCNDEQVTCHIRLGSAKSLKSYRLFQVVGVATAKRKMQ